MPVRAGHIFMMAMCLISVAQSQDAVECPATADFTSPGYYGYKELPNADQESPHWYSSVPAAPQGVPVTDTSTHGGYMYVHYLPSPQKDYKTSLVSPAITPRQSRWGCHLQFSLFSYGSPSPQYNGRVTPLRVLLQKAHSSQLLYQSKNFSSSWQTVKIDISSNETYQVCFSVSVAKGIFKTFVAIDDIVFSQGCCLEAQAAEKALLTPTHDHKACSWTRFEQGLGEFTQSGDRWKVGKEYLYPEDGAFAYVSPFLNALELTLTDKRDFLLKSPLYTATTTSSSCHVSFNVNLNSFEGPLQYVPQRSAQLHLLMLSGGTNKTIFHEFYQPSRNGLWSNYTVQLNSPQPFQLVFVAHIEKFFCVVGLDDIVFSSGCCASNNQATSANETVKQSGDLRLVGGDAPNTGRLEVHHSGTWGSICDDNWSLEDATVACRQLGYHLAAVPRLKADISNTGEVWMDEVDCGGTEQRLDECSFVGWGGTDCLHDEDVSLACISKNYAGVYEGAVRLTGGAYSASGRLQVFLNGAWQPVCQPQFTTSAAKVVCHQLGYTNHYNITLSSSFTVVANTKGWEFQCTGREQQLMSCKAQPSLGCHLHGQVSVSCEPPQKVTAESSSSRTSIIIGVLVLLIIAIVAVLVIFYVVRKRQRRNRIDSQRMLSYPLTTIMPSVPKDDHEEPCLAAARVPCDGQNSARMPCNGQNSNHYAMNRINMYHQQQDSHSTGDEASSDEESEDVGLLSKHRR